MPGTSDGIPEKEWDRVRDLCNEILHSIDSENDELEEENKKKLFDYLEVLIKKHGELPSILATKADFSSDDNDKALLLKKAFQIAEKRRDLANLTFISSSLAQVYIEDLEDLAEGRRWLSVLQGSLDSHWDDDEAGEFHRLENITRGLMDH